MNVSQIKYTSWMPQNSSSSHYSDFSIIRNYSENSDSNTIDSYEIWQSVIIGLLLASLILVAIVGNILVCTAVAIVKKLRTPSNLLIVSLAVSDLLVGLVVMPFAALYELTGHWSLGNEMCDMWTSVDVLVCSSSILNMFMISLDRYFVITKPFEYAMKRTPKRMALMIALAWISAALITVPPLFGWRGKTIEGLCGYSESAGYQIYATIFSFYLPLICMIFVYHRIYLVSDRIAKAEAKSNPKLYDQVCHSKSSRDSTDNSKVCNGPLKRNEESSRTMLTQKIKTKFFKKVSLSKISSKERKATKTLGVIMGAFTLCWLPFFIIAPIKPFCKEPDCVIPTWLSSIFLWLGYANSMLNPIIYARFNTEFRRPFKEILLCHCIGINNRLRCEQFAEQFGAPPCSTTVKDSIRPPIDTVVRYQSQGQTIVKLGNGDVSTIDNNSDMRL